MPLIVPPGFVLASYVLSGAPGTQPYVTTLGHEASLWAGEYQNMADYLMTAYFDAFNSETNNDLRLDRVTLYVGSEGPSGSVDSTLPAMQMTNVGDFGPTAMAVIARKQTATLGRRGRGRMFLPGTAREAGVNEDGSLTPTQVTGIQSGLDFFYETLTADVDPLVRAAPVLFHSSAPINPTTITGFTVAPLVGWIRGRIR